MIFVVAKFLFVCLFVCLFVVVFFFVFDKKVEKVIGPSYFTVKLSVYKTTSDMFTTIWAFKTRNL